MNEGLPDMTPNRILLDASASQQKKNVKKKYNKRLIVIGSSLCKNDLFHQNIYTKKKVKHPHVFLK